MTRSVNLQKIQVSPEHRPVFFAEIGSFFNGDPDLAASMIERVLAAGADCPEQPMVLKTEILNNPEICLPGDTLETYSSKSGQTRQEKYRDLIERKVMPIASYVPLFKMCRDAGVPFVVSVYDFEAASFAADHGAAALKIASANIVHVPLIRYVASFGLPVVIDTGRATIAEVYRAVDTAREQGCQDLIVQHSPDGHPAPAIAQNLRILETYKRAFGVPVGLSDHYVGVEMCMLAVALGASVLEKGVYDDPEELDQDISHVMHIADLGRVLRTIRDCWDALGKPAREAREKIDWVIGTSQRQGVVAKAALRAGDRVSLESVRFAFPCVGIPVEHWDLVDGWTITRDVAADSPVCWSDVRPTDKDAS